MEEWEGTVDDPSPVMLRTCQTSGPVEYSELGPGVIRPTVLLPPSRQALGALGLRTASVPERYQGRLVTLVPNENWLRNGCVTVKWCLRSLAVEHEKDDPEGFRVLMSTVRGDMDAARLESQLTSALKSSGIQDPERLAPSRRFAQGWFRS